MQVSILPLALEKNRTCVSSTSLVPCNTSVRLARPLSRTRLIIVLLTDALLNIRKSQTKFYHLFIILDTRGVPKLGPIADPKKIANAVVWLLSDRASFVLDRNL